MRRGWREWAHDRVAGARVDYVGPSGFRLAGDDPTLMRVVGADALRPDVHDTREELAVARALAADPLARPPSVGAPCVIVYASGTATMDPRAVRVVVERVALWRRVGRRVVRRFTRSVDED